MEVKTIKNNKIRQRVNIKNDNNNSEHFVCQKTENNNITQETEIVQEI